MNHQPPGNTGLKISEIGLGTWQLGGISWVAPVESDYNVLLCKAFDAGINLYDVSPPYGNGWSEGMVWEVFRERRSKDIINSPFGHGYLTGKYQCYGDIDEGGYPKSAFRATKPRELVEGMISRAIAFRALVNGTPHSAMHVAPKFILAHDLVSSAIPGHPSLVELEDNLAAADDGSYLSTDELQRVEEIYGNNQGGYWNVKRTKL